MSKVWPSSLMLAGAGKMGGALLDGWIVGGLSPEIVRLVDPYLHPGAIAVRRGQGIRFDLPSDAPDVLVLAIKPQTFSAEPGAFSAYAGANTLVVSILAGKTIATLRAAFPNTGAIVRAMPNLPASVGRGAAGLAAEPGRLSQKQKAVAETLFEAVGIAEWLDESLIDVVTALSGSGPAYVFYLVECLAEAGHEAGLSADAAMRLARATVEGAGALMAAAPDQSPSQLREAVTSPGGTTAAALDILRERNGLASLMRDAVAAAKERAGRLAT